jgi:type IV pilus assembly protein PilB
MTEDTELRDHEAAVSADSGVEGDGGSSKAASTGGGAIADLLIREGALEPEQLEYALRVQSKLSSPKPLLEVLTQLGLVTSERARQVLRDNRVSLRIGTLLVELGVLSASQLQAALALQKETSGKRLGEVLVENHFVSEEQMVDVLALQLGFPLYDDQLTSLDRRLARRAPTDWYRKHECLPIREEDGQVLIAFADPMNSATVDAARRLFGGNVVPGIARRMTIKAAIDRLESAKGSPDTSASENSVVRLANELLERALQDGASDIHIEPMKDKLRVRFRQDGVLIPIMQLPKDMGAPLSSRLKIMAEADIAERRRHQGGRMLFEASSHDIDMRVSFYVTIHGEKIVLRLLNNRDMLLNIEDLGMYSRMRQQFREDVLDVPSGVVLVTGPTGSGKTTTLYAAINYLNDVNTSIITAEDPVEYMIDGISQCSINPKIAITYDETLRHIVRQDPDVIVIGEVRDKFSAETAVQAALTGHKVLTTFHTEDSIGGLLRLLNMDIEAFLISSTVVCVVAQRLVRKVCPHCAEKHVLTADELRRLGYRGKDARRLEFRRGKGCQACRHTGYKGRAPIFELLVLNEMIKDALISRKTSYEIRRISVETTGLVTLLEDGIVKASRGLTTFEEIIRKLPRLQSPRPIEELYRLEGNV